MIDIHTHILPSVDDGASNIDISRGLIEEEIKNGVDTIVLTPHQNKEYLCKAELIEKFNEFKQNIGENVKLFLGSELYYYDDAIKDLKEDKILTINNSKYVLVEFSTRSETDIASIIYDIHVSGFKPIVAHIERYEYLSFEDIKQIASYALIQVNASSFEKKEYKKVLKFLMKNHLISFIASDCHNLTNRNVDFTYAKKFISKKYKEDFDKIFNNTLECLK